MKKYQRVIYKRFPKKLPSKKFTLSTHDLGIGLGTIGNPSEIKYIESTLAATEFYIEKAREKLAFDERERINQEFWKCVYDTVSYQVIGGILQL